LSSKNQSYVDSRLVKQAFKQYRHICGENSLNEIENDVAAASKQRLNNSGMEPKRSVTTRNNNTWHKQTLG
jgi:protoheme ferro-lyase